MDEFPDWIDVDGFNNRDAIEITRDLILDGSKLIYQGQLEHTTEINGKLVRVIGYPDFLIPRPGGYAIADAKLARSIYSLKADGSRKVRSKKKYIVHQLRLYGWLFEKQFPGLTFQLLVYNGAGEREPIDPPGEGVDVLGELKRLLAIEEKPDEPWEPVGWSKCGTCGFFGHCWPRAEEARELSLVPGIDQKLARKLRKQGVRSYTELARSFDAESLARLRSNAKTILSSAATTTEKVLENARALASSKPVVRVRNGEEVQLDPSITDDDTYVMFDLEGVPPGLDGWERIYLWGMQVFGKEKGEFLPVFAGFGEGGDREGWIEFLRIAKDLVDRFEGIRFVHWASYERSKINSYKLRYPDTDVETADRVLNCLVDLLPLAREFVALPLPSYSLKAVERLPQVTKFTGFKRSMVDVKKGDDSIAAFVEATETQDVSRRDELMGQLAAYNQEDLEATWAVHSWLRHLAEV